ncbi:glutamate receptor 1-like [Daphnia pulex]|uniref:glutamate receptor 1-like n=1 Tax=Daphnia pulex TaxID=6669 RepID=UPI001EDDF699|nr:glutamate receptor 1-like [Daphnia pulex]
MKLAWLIILLVDFCYGEPVTDVWRRDQPKSIFPVNGKHLRLLANPLDGIFDLKRNSTGHVVQLAGPLPLALDWLSHRYNFTYSYVPILEPRINVDDLPNKRGGIGYLRQGEADLFISAIVGSPTRFKYADYSAPWLSSPFSILIPIPNSSANVGALIEPMSTEVWICIALSVPAVIASLIGLSKCINALNKRIGSKPIENNSGGSIQIIDYVVCVILSQGAYCEKRQLAFRIAAAAWCLACFVLVQAYSSTLIAFITSPNTKPIINSVYDIPKVPGLKITVDRDYGADIKLLASFSALSA